MATDGPNSNCKVGLEEEKFNKAIEVLKEEHEHSTNSRISEKLCKIVKISQHFPANGKFQSNKEGVVDKHSHWDLIVQAALRVEANSVYSADVQVVNAATVEVTNSGLNGQGRTKKQRGKGSEPVLRHPGIAPCFRCVAIGHWKNECKESD